ncbi:MAG: Phosphoribosylformylglycinamidine synthase [Opitutia bacterium UBA7350]|nr:MAG: Phosphoribosylformylglycinamidine synthase [Opitutae bacterium UBA7350]
MQAFIFKGQPILSEFRLKALLAAFAEQVKASNETGVARVDTIDAVAIYVVKAQAVLDTETRLRALALLNAMGEFDRPGGFFVTPRKGTISPWSTKASDIFRNCSLEGITSVERGIHYYLKDKEGKEVTALEVGSALHALHDRMTEAVYEDLSDFFVDHEPAPHETVPLLKEGAQALHQANVDWGLAMSETEVDYLAKAYQGIGRDPTDVELVMFSQVNSEHCRHKIFNADWIVDGVRSQESLFKMIRNTHATHPEGVLVAYSDNSGVLEGVPGEWWEVDPQGNHQYRKTKTTLDILCKVETHNHPTAISPFPGAATGVGGEIRDEGATGIGGRSKAGLSAFVTSHLQIPGYPLPWENDFPEHPTRMATPFQIMQEGPIGGAAFGNEFGRPQICGLFRTFQIQHDQQHRGYHKPIMAAGGMGNLKREHVAKKDIPPNTAIIQLGGPAMKIGLGGGAASSLAAGNQSEALDFDSVQRGNPEMQRRCQQVIDACIALGVNNPMLSIHDIGAGGLSNGLPELVEATGGIFHLRNIHNEDRSMSPMEIWCNESQERYVLAVDKAQLEIFEKICKRERCPFAMVGMATDNGRLTLHDSHFKNAPIDLPMDVLLGKTPKLLREVKRKPHISKNLQLEEVTLQDAVDRVLRFPAVANKTFLITITDRTITGMVSRDQMVGPWQTPVSDVAVTTTSMDSYQGEAMAMGERTPIAVLNAPASGRIAIGECLTNLAAANTGAIENIKLSANWMVAAGEDGEDANLYDTVKAVGMELCPALGICIPVGKDSMSMRSSWQDSEGILHKQVSPLSLMVTGFSPVRDVRRTLTPDLKSKKSQLILIDLGKGQNRLGGSTLAQVYNQLGDTVPDLDDPDLFRAFFDTMQVFLKEKTLLSYHDRSDGGLLATISEMAIAGRTGMRLSLDSLVLDANQDAILAALFTEELGAVLEVDPSNLESVTAVLKAHGLSKICHNIGETVENQSFVINLQGRLIYESTLSLLNAQWSEMTYQMQAKRDNPVCAKEEYEAQTQAENAGILIQPKYDAEAERIVHAERFSIGGVRPRIAVLREQGTNGQNEMAFAFGRAGFEAVDVHMTDLLLGTTRLDGFSGLAACGGFSYGDVLGAGSGWARSILYNTALKDQFSAFFARSDSFSLGVCNGCQMLAQLKDIIPGAEAWPHFVRNLSEQFEARYANVEVLKSPSLFLSGMTGSLLPIPVAHGEGRADFQTTGDFEQCCQEELIGLRYIGADGQPTMKYPANPNGSPEGATAFTTLDGRVTVMMPHPERCFRSVQMSFRPQGSFEGEAGPWLKLFENARSYLV